MSLANGQNKITYIVTALTSVFSFPFKYWDDSDIVVTVLNNATNAATVYTIGDDYTVVAANGDPANGADVTFAAGVDGHTITLERIVPISSEADYKTGDGIPAEALNQDFDKAAAQNQQLDDLLTRQIQAPTTDPAGLSYELPSAALRAGKVSAYDADGNVIVLELAESGSFAGDSTKGIDIAANVASVKVDAATIGFDGGGNLEIIEVPLSLIEAVADQTVIANLSGGALAPVEVPLVGATGLLLDDDSLTDDDPTKGATQQSIKAYIDYYAVHYPAVSLSTYNATFPDNVTSDMDLSELLPDPGIKYLVTVMVFNNAPTDVLGVADGGVTTVIPTITMEAGAYHTFTGLTDTAGSLRWASNEPGAASVYLTSYQRVISD